MRRSLVVLPALAIAGATPLLLPTGGEGESPPASTVPATIAPKPTVVARKVYRRRHVVSRDRFVPDARPGPRRVRRIVAHEAVLWGASAARLNCRINGESGHAWNASNGQYAGLGQFAASTFYRGLASIGTRKVRTITTRVRRPRSVVKTLYSNGRLVRTRGARYRQVRKRVSTGWIPAGADRLHGWAQVRIMARAMVGLGNVNDSEWEVRC